ncbi:branched-chain amino acid aminotransferase [compost metagenome]
MAADTVENQCMRIIQAQKVIRDSLAHARLPHCAKYAMGSAFINGEYKGLHEAAIPIVDMGFLQADAVYDVMTVSKGAFFRLDDHLKGMRASCERLHLKNPYSRAQTVEILSKLVALAGTKDAYVWWCVTRGLWLGGDRADLDAFDNCLYAFVTPHQLSVNDEQRERGLDVMTRRTTARMGRSVAAATGDMALALFEVRGQCQDKDWVVQVDSGGYLVEVPGHSIFVIRGGALYTCGRGRLPGSMRKSVLELAAELGVRSDVVRLSKADLLSADEAFIGTSDGDIAPINSVDGRLLGGVSGVGPLTQQFHDCYWKKRWGGWYATPVDYVSRATPKR